MQSYFNVILFIFVFLLQVIFFFVQHFVETLCLYNVQNKRIGYVLLTDKCLPFDVDVEEPLYFCVAATHCGGKRLPLTVAEEDHLQHMGVIHRHTATCHLTVTVLERQQIQSLNARVEVKCFIRFNPSYL